MTMLTLTFAGDEAGDVSFAFEKGASRYFVVAVIATTDPDRLRKDLADLRRNCSLPAEYEFRFHELTSLLLRKRVFDVLVRSNFEGWALVVDKMQLSDPFRVMRPLDFYLYFVTELIRLIPLEKRKDAILILDEFGSANTQRTELRRFMVARHIERSFRRIQIKRSRSESLIQVADLVAGAVLRRGAKADAEAYEMIKEKISRIWEYAEY